MKRISDTARKSALLLSGGIVGAIATTLLISGVPHAHAKGAARVAPWDAIKSATAKVPGSKPFSATYVSEGGKWMYDVILIKGKTITEVEVDATTGKAGDSETVTPEEEGKEMASDLNKAIGNASKVAPEKDEKDEADEKNEKGKKP